MKKIFIVVSPVLLICICQAVWGEAWYVDGSVSESGDGTSWETALKTIQEGIEAASDGDSVVVADGKYAREDNNIDFQGKAITLRSQNGPATCTIDCQKSGRGLYFRSGEDHSSVIDGFTITNACAVFTSPDEYDECGGGIVCDNSSPTITNCVISGNHAYMSGGGIYCLASDAVITNCRIVGNSSEEANGGGIACVQGSHLTIASSTISDNEASGGDGGGIYCRGGTATITDCTLIGNTYSGTTCHSGSLIIERCIIANNKGPGVATMYGSGSIIINCTIYGNHYAAVRCQSDNPQITNCTLVGNRSSGIYCFDSSPIVRNSIVWANSDSSIVLTQGSTASINYCDVEGGSEGEGNIDTDPTFVALGHWDDAGTPGEEWDDVWIGEDLHLQSGSPCIDAGQNSAVPPSVLTDLDGKSRIVNGTVDMGAFEFQGVPRVTITRDGDVVTLQWREFGDGQYTVQWTEDLVRGTWQPAPGAPLSEIMWNDIVTADVKQRFYRVESGGIYTDPVGFVKVFIIEGGFTMISVPLGAADNKLNGGPGCIGDTFKEAFSGGTSAGDADTLWKWDASTQNYETAYLIAGRGEGYDGKWWDDDTGDFSTMTLDVGECCWILRRTRAPASP